MNTYSTDGNVIRVQFQESAPQPKKLHVADTELRDWLYSEVESIATMKRGKQNQKVWFVKGEAKYTTAWAYTKDQVDELSALGYAEEMAALKRLYAVNRIFGLELVIKVQGEFVTALNQLTEEIIERQVQIGWNAYQLLNK